MRTHTRFLLAAVAATAACSHRDSSGAGVAFGDSAAAAAAIAPLGPGDARVTSTDGAIILTLVGDTVRMQLGDSLRRSVQRQLDTAGSGIGGMITRSVSGIVGSAMAFVASIPVASIEDIHYEDGRIEIGSRNGNSKFSMNGKGNNANARFSPEDGERFVAAVKARQAALPAR